jgi:hypothetical protein
VAPCTKADNACFGDTLTACGSDGLLYDQTCSAASCQSSGYVGYLGGGMSGAGYVACLCEPCKASDNTCLDTKTAQVCDTVSGKVAPQACGVGQTCKAGACLSSCTTSADCGNDEICSPVTGYCDAASGKTYTMKIVDAAIGGSGWDSDGSAPDPYVEVSVNGSLVCSTNYKSDTYYPYWGVTCNQTLTLSQSDTLLVVVWDDDFGLDDTLGSKSWTGSALVGLLHDGAYDASMSSNGTTLYFKLTPN